MEDSRKKVLGLCVINVKLCQLSQVPAVGISNIGPKSSGKHASRRDIDRNPISQTQSYIHPEDVSDYRDAKSNTSAHL
jgi:hypothetical protein